MREADVGAGRHRCRVIGRHQGIKVGMAEHTPGESLRALHPRIAYGSLRSHRTLRPCGAAFTCGALRANGANLSRRPLWARGACFSLRSLGTNRALQARSAGRALGSGQSGFASLSLGAARSHRTDRALGAGCASRAYRTLRTDWTSRPFGALRPLRAGRADHARILIFIVITAALLIVAVVLATVLTVVAVAITCISHERILSAHSIHSFVDFGGHHYIIC